MKVFIVFMGILIIDMSFLFYQGDLGSYLRMQTTVKALAEECGAGAALYYDAEAYGNGYLSTNPGEALKYVDHVLANAQRSRIGLLLDEIDCTVSFFDDTKVGKQYFNGSHVMDIGFDYPYRYVDAAGKEIIVDAPSIVVTLSVNADNLFRLPFLDNGNVVRSAMYELKPDS